jgi:hypothetical protein
LTLDALAAIDTVVRVGTVLRVVGADDGAPVRVTSGRNRSH